MEADNSSPESLSTFELLVRIERPDNGHSTKIYVVVQAASPDDAQERLQLPKGYSGYDVDKILSTRQIDAS